MKHSIKIERGQKGISDQYKKVQITTATPVSKQIRVVTAAQLQSALGSIDALIKNHEAEIDNLKKLQKEKQEMLQQIKTAGLKI